MRAIALGTALSAALAFGQLAQAQDAVSEVIQTVPGEVALKQTVEIDADLETVWALFTTGEGAASWMAPVAEVDLRMGGAIRTNYDACAELEDGGWIENRIVNFVPRRMLTLPSDLGLQREASWMNETVYAARDNLYAVFEFEALKDGRTRIVAWGLGYGDGPEWETIIGFFIASNEWTFGQLHKALAGEEVYAGCEPGG